MLYRNINFIVERGTINDAETIAGFQQAMAMESEGISLDSEKLLKGVTSALEDSGKGIYYLAKTVDNKIVGSLFITKEWSDWNNCWYWWIQSVYVLPEYRNNSVFSTLYNHIKNIALDEDVNCFRLYVDKDNINAQNCYQKIGMTRSHYLMYEELLK